MKPKRKGQNRHHLTPRSRGGQSIESNLLWIDIERHNAWHAIFGNKTLDEVIELLIRLRDSKSKQKRNQRLN